MMRIFTATLTIFLTVATLILTAQDNILDRKYATQEYFNEFIPAMTGSGSVFGTSISIRDRQNDIENKVKALTPDINIRPVKVEVIFHMLFTDDRNEATSLAKDQLHALNRDFHAINPPASHPNDPLGRYISLAENPKIKFDDARIEATSQYGQGIATLKDVGAVWEKFDDMKDEASRGADPISPGKYINIWVVALPDHLASYASSIYQNEHNAGIVIDHRFFGERTRGDHGFYEGKTLTHLIGNYLGLMDLWNEYEPCRDDLVRDTPRHNAPNKGQPRYKHVTTCETRRLVQEMTMNFMDATDDEYQMMFTEGQAKRMHAVLQVAREGLINSSN